MYTNALQEWLIALSTQ